MAQQWEYSGTDLQTLAYDVKLLGDAQSIPPRRGDNVVIPSRDGRYHTSKYLDQRTLSLAMFVSDKHPTGGAASEAQMLANLDTLKALFSQSGQHELRHTMGGETRYAQAEVISEVHFKPKGYNNLFIFTVDFVLADPAWYAAASTVIGPTTIIQSPQTIEVVNDGTYPSYQAVLTVEGPIENLKFTVGTVWVSYSEPVADGETLVLDCGTWIATLDGVDVSGYISHEGSLKWLEFPVATNSLVVTSSGWDGGTTVQVEFTKAYL